MKCNEQIPPKRPFCAYKYMKCFPNQVKSRCVHTRTLTVADNLTGTSDEGNDAAVSFPSRNLLSILEAC
jgi:hypothetical protein